MAGEIRLFWRTRKFLRVKRSGLAAPRHANDLWVLFALAPKAQKHEVCLAEAELIGARAPVIEDVLIQERVQLRNADVQLICGFHFGIKLFERFKRSGHLGVRILPFGDAGEQVCCTFSPQLAKSGKLPHTSSQ
jgi:hypothetical protein